MGALTSREEAALPSSLPAAPLEMCGVRARAYRQHRRQHNTARIMRRLAFRADMGLSIATVIKPETAR